MKYLQLILALSVLFTSVSNEVFAQQAVFNVGVYDKEYTVIGQNISDYSAQVTLENGTDDFARGNLIMVSYKSYLSSTELHTMLFVCGKTTTTLYVRSVNEKAAMPLQKLDALKTVRLASRNADEKRQRALEESCD